MKLRNLTAAVAIAMSVNAWLPSASAEMIAAADTAAIVNGAQGVHWYLDANKWYHIKWNADGSIEAYHNEPNADDKPFDSGKWWIKKVKPLDDESQESVDARNAALEYVYCHEFEALFSGHDLCWELQRETNTMMEGDDKKLAKTQRYKLYREAGAETGEYVITSQ